MSSAGLDRCQLEDCFFPSTNCGAGFMAVSDVPIIRETPVKIQPISPQTMSGFPGPGRPFGLKDLRFLFVRQETACSWYRRSGGCGQDHPPGHAFPGDLSRASNHGRCGVRGLLHPSRVGRTSPVIFSSIPTVRSSFRRTPRSRGDFQGCCI